MAVASKTLKAFHDVMMADQGASFRKFQRITMPQAEDAYREEDDGARSHLGASLIGRECDRELFYGFRWASPRNKFDPRMLRLFNRGHLEEARFVALLMMIGCTVYQHDANGKQYRISDIGGHFGGSGDGVVVGLPDFEPTEPVLTEFKTHNEKSFKGLVTNGVREEKWEHFVQMQVYMHKMGLKWACYFAVCKNDDMIHAEMIAYEQAVGERYIIRAGKIIVATVPPPKMNESPTFFKCRFCDHRRICHFGERPAFSCRTCYFAQVVENGWHCAYHNKPLTKQDQLAGCDNHKYDDLWNPGRTN